MSSYLKPKAQKGPRPNTQPSTPHVRPQMPPSVAEEMGLDERFVDDFERASASLQFDSNGGLSRRGGRRVVFSFFED